MIIPHDSKPTKRTYYSKVHSRQLVTDAEGAQQCQLWEQWLPVDGYILRHYHENEELITILAGRVEVALGDQVKVVDAPATVLIPAQVAHGFRNLSGEPVHLLAYFATNNPQQTYDLPEEPKPAQWDD